MTKKQYLWLWQKVKPFMSGHPDPDQYIWELGDLWEAIKRKSSNKDEAEQALHMLVTFRNILDAASKEGVEL